MGEFFLLHVEVVAIVLVFYCQVQDEAHGCCDSVSSSNEGDHAGYVFLKTCSP